MVDKFVIYFDRTGLRGAAVPESIDAEVIAANFAFFKRISRAIEDFGTRILEIEAAHAALMAAQTEQLVSGRLR